DRLMQVGRKTSTIGTIIVIPDNHPAAVCRETDISKSIFGSDHCRYLACSITRKPGRIQVSVVLKNHNPTSVTCDFLPTALRLRINMRTRNSERVVRSTPSRRSMKYFRRSFFKAESVLCKEFV